MSRFSIQSLLNDSPPSPSERVKDAAQRVDASDDLRSLIGAVSRIRAQETPLLVTPQTHYHLQHLLASLSEPALAGPPARPLQNESAPPQPLRIPPCRAPTSSLAISQRRMVSQASPPAHPHPPSPTPQVPVERRRFSLSCAPTSSLQPRGSRTLEYDVHIAEKSRVAALYRYPLGATVEYPESGEELAVGHLIPIDPAADLLPWADFAYSRGSPDGGWAKRDVFFTHLLVDSDGNRVPCKKRHTTCQGVKACPLNDFSVLTGSDHRHTSATRQDIEHRLAADREARQRLSSPQRDVFVKTAAYITAIRKVGCRRPCQEETHRDAEELRLYNEEQSQYETFRRGQPSIPTCQGRIRYYEYPDPDHPDAPPRSYLSCEHYSRRTPDHWAEFGLQDAGLDVDYIAAQFQDNSDELARIEEAAALTDVGPLGTCVTLRNFAAQTQHCPLDHCVDGRLTQLELTHIECQVKFRMWFPVDLQRCPFVLVTSKGVHRHPIPLPEKTPRNVRAQVFALLHTLRQDLADMTARRFLRHPAVKSFLISRFPDLPTPTLSALHPSLANRAHLGSYIARCEAGVGATPCTPPHGPSKRS
ncbi:hypothetical protein DFH06DRAFT_1340161 [Mycena polygramma]|nr:hypothetical protein DFH06DRAFT_1340161 [Mycena polygramma]